MADDYYLSTDPAPDPLFAYMAGSTKIFDDPNLVAIESGQVSGSDQIRSQSMGDFWGSVVNGPERSDGQTAFVEGEPIDWSQIAAKTSTFIQSAVRTGGQLADLILGRRAPAATPAQPRQFQVPMITLPAIGQVSIITIVLISVAGFFLFRFAARR